MTTDTYWRVGHHNPRNIYAHGPNHPDEGEHIGVMFTGDHARQVCDAINATAAAPTVYALPDEPDTPLWDRHSREWRRTQEAHYWKHSGGTGAHAWSLPAPWHELLAQCSPLSTTPPREA